MKIIKYFFTLILALTLLPVFTNALDKNYCDNVVYQSYYERFGGKTNLTDDVKFVMGEKNNRGKYIKDTLDYCADPKLEDKCDWAQFGGDRHGYDRALVNMPTFALLLNNIPLYEALITTGGYGYLIDNGVYMVQEEQFNEEFLTEAFQAVKEGQVGVLEYLITNHKPNLLKLSGYVYRSPYLPHEPVNVKELAKNSLEKYKERDDYARVECMLAVQRVIENWYKKHEHEKEYVEDAARYNAIVKKWAPIYRVENNMPFEFSPSLDFLKLQSIDTNSDLAQKIDGQIENNLATIDKQVAALIANIMRDFDFSTFGNQI